MKDRHLTDILLFVLLFVFLAGSAAAAYGLWQYHAGYERDRDRYSDLDALVITRETAAGQAVHHKEESRDCSEGCSEEESALSTEGETGTALTAPVSVDWEILKDINPDITGWVYFCGLPHISYPLLQADDNGYYVHRSFDLSSDDSKAGSVFIDCRMNADLTFPYTVIYGHNMRDGSMFSDLGRFMEKELYEKEPYFWILTPESDRLYRIFSVFTCHRSADVFQEEFFSHGSAFLAWRDLLVSRNVMQDDFIPDDTADIIAFSTCVPDSYDRTIVCGASVREYKKTTDP